MVFVKKYIGHLFFSNRFYAALGGVIVLYVLAFFVPPVLFIPQVAGYSLLLLSLADYIFLFILGKPPAAKRIMAERFSNGDDNKVQLQVANMMPFAIVMEIIDELPVQFQQRNWRLKERFKGREQKILSYTLRPSQRGVYDFGSVLLYTKTSLGLVVRRHPQETGMAVQVYPSYMQVRKYALLSQATVQNETGTRRMRRIGHSMEFEQIKEYVLGDDIRTINWKATARKASLMVNNYTDERSQQVYCIIDKGRLMKMPFNQLSLLDYAINSTLVLSSVCLQKQDRIGLITFDHKMGAMLAADRKPIQTANIQQLLYNEATAFLESDYEMLYMQVRSRVKQRSLMVLFTNFESLSGLRRQLPYLRSIAKHHLLLVVFFENTGLAELAALPANDVEQVYSKTIAGKFTYEKKLIVKELQQHGILSILTPPEKLTINAVNKYLELKARQAV
ncbi:MAG TPA: DUF58 domain-containing protein [Ferruginibacter sp.]|nr:DUF58 domain-containing protein [Ferruginibacter sp.]HMP21353.1 DUF58 domain-containing protein [Ferruginibacter sp.]